jgi:hypothetical protein
MRGKLPAALVVCMVFGVPFAGDACDKPYSKWNTDFVAKLLTDSSWSRPHALGRVFSQIESEDRVAQTHFPDREQSRSPVRTDPARRLDRGPGIAGEKEIVDSYTLRLFSALPIRQAFIRQFQIANKYDQMSAEEKSRLDGQFEQALKMDVSQRIMVSVTFQSNNREMEREVTRQLIQATADSLQQRAFLITDREGRIPLIDYYPPGRDGAGAKLIFPRTINGNPAVQPGDSEFRLEFFVPGTDHKIFVIWKVKDLVCKGELLI